MSSEARYWEKEPDGSVRCTLCPRDCHLREGQPGFCYVRQNRGGKLVSVAWGRSTGFAIDPIEKKPLAHFHPGSTVLSFGTAGCNLGCRFCQNWDISKARDLDRLSARATPEMIAQAAVDHGCKSVAFTYNDPVIFAEWAIDVAAACRARGVATVAVTAGYITASARAEFYAAMDAANVDLKAFTEEFYRTQCAAELAPVKDTLRWLVHESNVWVEVTTLLIPGHNDGADEIGRLVDWYVRELGPEVPLHFTAFHPDYKLDDRPPTPPATLRRARQQALDAGLRHVYTGNIVDVGGQGTTCAGCGARVIGRDGYRLLGWGLTDDGACRACGHRLAGRFAGPPGGWGARRLRVVP